MDIHEYQAKEILAGFGVAIPRGGLAYSPEQAAYRAREIGGAVYLPAGEYVLADDILLDVDVVGDGPGKTIWGAEQKAWFKRTVAASDATFRVLISPTPIVGPDRGNKNDNHANKGFTHEGDEIRAFIASQKNMYIVCGDRHWQYVSIDPKTGVKEFSCGPTTDKHASGFSQKNRSEMHRYLKIKGGFLSVTIDRKNGKSFASFKHHDTYGGVYNEELIEAKK